MLVDFELFKKYSRTDDFTGSDDLLEEILRNAEETVIGETNRTVEELTEMNGGKFPGQLRQAIMMLASYWYEQVTTGGVQNVQEVPWGVTAMVKRWRKLTGLR